MKQNLEIAGMSAGPGTRQAQVLALTLAGTPVKLPIVAINGAHPGPTVVVTAGVHGAEYVGIETAQRLAQRTDPQEMYGQLVVAPIANMTAFAKRSIYVCPPDGKNLNRCFPGNAAGTFADCLADWLFQNLIHRADFYLDLHGGDMNEALVPFTIVSLTGRPALDDKAIALAQAYGLPYIVKTGKGASSYAAAAQAGICAALAEVGGQGLWPESSVLQHAEGLQRALVHIGLFQQPSKEIGVPPRVLQEMRGMRSEHDGLFYPTVAVGDVVTAGQAVGRVTDYLGNTVQPLIAPVSGIVLFVVTSLAMNNADPLLGIGVEMG